MTRAEFERVLAKYAGAVYSLSRVTDISDVAYYIAQTRAARAAVLAAFGEAKREPTHD